MFSTRLNGSGGGGSPFVAWFAALTIGGLFTACKDATEFKPLAYTSGPFESCGDTVTDMEKISPLERISSGFDAQDSDGNKWDFWGRLKEEGKPAGSGGVLVPYDKSMVSSWFAWNTVWPTAGVWSREKPEETALRDPAYFNGDYTEADFGTGLQFFVGKDDRRVQTDRFNPKSPDLNPIARACFNEKDCIPSLVTEGDEGSLWMQCTSRPGLDDQDRPKELDSYPCDQAVKEFEQNGEKKKKYYCCGWDEPEPPNCCDAVDLPRYNIDMAKLIPDAEKKDLSRIQALDDDHLREKKWYMRETDLVFGLLVGGQPRAYPLKILWWHEVINDSVVWKDAFRNERKTRFSVAYSTLTDSLEILDTVDRDDLAYSLGITGFALNNNHILYDRLTESWWSPLRFQKIRGALSSEENRHIAGCPLPAIETTWKKWKEWFPNTSVLSADTGFRRNYTQYPYRVQDKQILTDYRVDDANTFRVTNPLPEHFEPATKTDKSANPNYVKNKERVFGVVTPTGQRGYLFRDIRARADDKRRKTKELDAEGKEKEKVEAGSAEISGGKFSTSDGANFAVINDRVGDLDVVIFWEAAGETLTPDNLRIFDTPPDRIRVYLRPKGKDGRPVEFIVPGSKPTEPTAP